MEEQENQFISENKAIWSTSSLHVAVQCGIVASLSHPSYRGYMLLLLVFCAQMKKLEAAHHRWQRSILGSWKDEVTNEKVREATALPKLEYIIKCRRLRWLGHLSCMEWHRIPWQAQHWEPNGFRRPVRPRQNWRGVMSKDLKKIGIEWDEVQEAAEDRRSWWICVAQCVFDAGWTRNQDFKWCWWPQ